MVMVGAMVETAMEEAMVATETNKVDEEEGTVAEDKTRGYILPLRLLQIRRGCTLGSLFVPTRVRTH